MGMSVFKSEELEIFKYGEVYRVHYFSDKGEINPDNKKSRVTKNIKFVEKLLKNR